MIRKLVALVGLVVACGGLGLFVALGTYVWSLKVEVNKQTELLATKANDAGKEAAKAIQFVDNVIAQARTDLDNARPKTVKPSRQVNPWEMVLAQSASQRLAGSVDKAHGAVVTASDAVVVAKAALEVFDQPESSDLNRLLGFQSSQVDATRTTLGNAARELEKAKMVLGGEPTPEQLNAVAHALNQAEGFANELSKVVKTVLGRVNATKTLADQWAWRIALGTTLMSALAGVGQLFMARFFWRTLRGQPA
jgi:hydrogenase maturation protease